VLCFSYSAFLFFIICVSPSVLLSPYILKRCSSCIRAAGYAYKPTLQNAYLTSVPVYMHILPRMFALMLYIFHTFLPGMYFYVCLIVPSTVWYFLCMSFLWLIEFMVSHDSVFVSMSVSRAALFTCSVLCLVMCTCPQYDIIYACSPSLSVLYECFSYSSDMYACSVGYCVVCTPHILLCIHTQTVMSHL
jgi:hypothetical protein